MRFLCFYTVFLLSVGGCFAADGNAKPINKQTQAELIATIERLQRVIQETQGNMRDVIAPAMEASDLRQQADAATIAALRAQLVEKDVQRAALNRQLGNALAVARQMRDQLAQAEGQPNGVSEDEVIRRIARATDDAERRADALAHQLAAAQKAQGVAPDEVQRRIQTSLRGANEERETLQKQLEELRSFDGWLFHKKGIPVWMSAVLIFAAYKKGKLDWISNCEKKIKNYLRKNVKSQVIKKKVRMRSRLLLLKRALKQSTLHKKYFIFTKRIAHRIS